MENLMINPIGITKQEAGRYFVQLTPEYRAGLTGLQGFSHLVILWWFDQVDIPELRETLVMPAPYKHGPELMGTFATRGPVRPNPIAVTMAEIVHIDEAKGCIEVTYLDAEDGSPLVDLKPYTPSSDFIEQPQVPAWCAHWPRSFETSADFDWASEFNF